MSFILDALRKSEHERERRQLPGLAEAPVAKPAPSKLPLVLAGVGALLAVNLVVLVVLLARDDADAPPAGVTSTASAPDGAPANLPARAPTAPDGGFPAPAPPPAREVRPLTEEAIAAAPDTDFDYAEPPPITERAPVRTGGASIPEPTLAAPTPVPGDGRVGLARPPTPAVPPPRAAATPGIPSINDLAPQATAGLPALNLNLHVYSTDPAQRFVVLNGTRYREGGRLTEGPTLERITAEGAVLNHNGLRFLLPRE